MGEYGFSLTRILPYSQILYAVKHTLRTDHGKLIFLSK